MRGFALAVMVLLTSCNTANDLQPELFDYHGLQLRFPEGTVDAQMPEAGAGQYARLSPSGSEGRGGYFIDLGRPRTGTKSSGLLWLGFVSVSDKAAQIDLGDGYVMYCEGELPAVQSCAVLLRELPKAAVNFVIGPRPDVFSAHKAVLDAEDYLRAAIAHPKNTTEA